MSESKHTPGPWYASIGLNDKEFSYGNIGPIRGETCGVAFAKLLPVWSDYEPKTIEANARLIAAAPDLLAAAEVVLWMTGRRQIPTDPAGVYGWEPVAAARMEQAGAILRTAIAKAKGKSE